MGGANSAVQKTKSRICLLHKKQILTIGFALPSYYILIDFFILTHLKLQFSIKRLSVNPLPAGAAYIRVFIFYQHIKYHLLTMLKIKCDINQQYLKTVDLHFVKSE